MEPILLPSLPSAASTRGLAEPKEKAGSPDAAQAGENRFESILKSVAAVQEDPMNVPPSAQEDGRRDAIAAEEAEANPSPPLSVSPIAWGSVVFTAPAQAPGAGGVEAAPASPAAAASGSKDAAPTEAGPAPVLAGLSSLPAEGDPLPEQASSGIRPLPAYVPENAALVNAVPADLPGAAPASPAATASNPGDASTVKPARADVAGAAPASPAAPASGPKDAAPMKAVRVDLPETAPAFLAAAASNPEDAATVKPVRADVAGAAPASPAASAFPAEAASEPKGAASATTEGIPAYPGDAAPAQEGARDAGGTRKKKDDLFPRIEGKAEPATPPPAEGNREISGRPTPPRPVGSAPDPGVVRFEEKAFVITRKSDTSVEVTLAPPGVGKLELEVVLEKGIVNARITAADPAGREAITRELPRILEALARDGMNVGGFTVSLKGRRDRSEDAPVHGTSRDPDARPLSPVSPSASPSPASAGFVDIFV
ncbi:MAG: flagellar hook-length control protein FliK [bacterium]|jgi:hypothetical protein